MKSSFFKRILSSALSILLLTALVLPASAAESAVNICINGSYVSFSDEYGYPYISSENRTMVPLAVTMQAAGAKVSWGQATNTATVEKDGISVKVPIGESYILVDGKKVENDAPARVNNGRTYLPIAVVLQSVGYKVEWEASSKTVFVSSQEGAVKFTTYVPYSTGNLELLIKNLLKGNVVYYDGQYWATPEYANMIANENIVSSVDISGGSSGSLEQEYVDSVNQNTNVIVAEEWVKVSELDKVASAIGIKKIMSGQSSSAQVTDMEILKYCMPSIPEGFDSNPVPGTYDGIRVVVENGVILLNKNDLKSKNLL